MCDFIEIASVPVSEDCQQVGTSSYDPKLARLECEAFKRQLIRQFGAPPEGARLSVKSFSHDFGNYSEAVCYFDDELPDSVEYAFKLEAETPEFWDMESIKELRKDSSFGRAKQNIGYANYPNWAIKEGDICELMPATNMPDCAKYVNKVFARSLNSAAGSILVERELFDEIST